MCVRAKGNPQTAACVKWYMPNHHDDLPAGRHALHATGQKIVDEKDRGCGFVAKKELDSWTVSIVYLPM